MADTQAHVIAEKIPASVQNKDAHKWASRRVNTLASELNLNPKEFVYIAEFHSEPGRVLYKPLGHTGVGGVN